MTTQSDFGQENRFVRAFLPWLVAAAGMAVYLLTLNHWVSFPSLPYVARATGKMWTPELSGFGPMTGPFSPLHCLLTYPIRWLPEAWAPLALNLFSVVCATLTLGLLARSVALLPHNRTHEQRQREHGPHALLSLPTAWIAPVLAAIACGLQLAFWQQATAASTEALDALLFAYVVRCLLEYRIVQRNSWLFRAGLVYGAAVTGDWLMVALGPVFILSLVWLKRSKFFKLRFLGAMLLCGLVGMLLYLLFPLIYVLSANPIATFWQALKVNILAEKTWLFTIWRLPTYVVVLLATTSFLPLLLISVRWASYFGDPSKIGIATTTAILHIAHGALLAVCVWVTFDPVFSPHFKGLAFPALDYLCALSIGYFTGYFLLVFKPVVNRGVPTPAWYFLLNRLSRAWILALLILVPFGLIYRNLPQIRLTNGPAMREYAALLTTNLPPHAALLCDSESLRLDLPRRLWLAEAWLARSGRAKDYLFVDTLGLEAPSYHEFQRSRHPNDWPALAATKSGGGILPSAQLGFIVKLSDQRPVYYLNPSFGYYFEIFYPRLHGLTPELKRYPTNSLNRMPLELAEIAENEGFWKTTGPALQRLLPAMEEDDPNHARTFGGWLLHSLKIPFEPNPTAQVLGRYYSQPLNMWGVQLQQFGRLQEAGRHFDYAVALCADSLPAKANSDCNRQLRLRHKTSVPPTAVIQQEFGKYRDWLQPVRDGGPFDDPMHCFIQAVNLAANHLVRQAAQQFERVSQFDPENPLPQYWLARFYANVFPDKSLALISGMRTRPEALLEIGIKDQELSSIEAVALFSSHRAPEAELVLQKVMDEHPRDENLFAMVAHISATFGSPTNALRALEHELQINPTNTAALVVQGYLHMQASNYSEAIPPLTRALTIETNNYTARFDRAIAYLCNDQLDRALNDYRILLRVFPKSFKIYYGLGEIAWRRKDTNSAIRYYELYLTNSVPESEETKTIATRLQSLLPPSP